MTARITLSALMISAASAAAAAPCDVYYEIQPGERLSDISQAAYGFSSYQLIYSRNLSVISSIAALPVGETIVIPCQPGELGLSPDAVALTFRMLDLDDFADVAAKAPPAPTPAAVTTEAPAAQAEAPEAAMRLLTANGLEPLAGETLPEGGMSTAIVTRAFAAAGRAEAPAVEYLGGRDAHRAALNEGGFALSFPWRRPDCVLTDRLGETETALCDGYDFSDALFESISGVFALSGAAPRREAGFNALLGLRICRPAGEPVSDLAERGIDEFSSRFVRPATMEDCLSQLLNGEVDVVSGEVFDVDAAVNDLGLRDRVEEAPQLAMISTIHAIAPKGDAEAQATLAELNAGIAAIKANGEWFRVVARFLTAR